jgi:asparagine synthase (glutamine-hydrolysing)
VQSLEETVLPALLRYEDRNSMAFSLESRLPFLTAALADFAYSLPSEHLISNDANGKQVLRCAMRGMVPEAILNRRDKIGFATPDRLWARSLRPWLHQVLASEPAQNLLWLDAPKARRSLDRHLESHATNFNSQFWRTIALIRWVERYKIKIAG